MDLTTTVKLALYERIASSATVPGSDELAAGLQLPADTVRAAFGELASQRLLVLQRDTGEILMAPPFSAVATPHHAEVDGRAYMANCVWDAFGVVAALGGTGVAVTRAGGTGTELRFPVADGIPEPVAAVFHYAVPASRWWEDIVFT